MRTSYLKSGNKEDCCSCGACAQSCPARCLTMTYREGFYYPSLEEARCLHCDRCLSVCQYNRDLPASSGREPSFYAAWNRDPEILRASTSGGVFPAIGEAVLRQGGAVFGAVYNEDWQIVTVCAESPETLRPMSGSKYAMGSTEETFRAVQTMLKTGRTVLYTGTPCQIAGLRAFLSAEHDNLYTADIICHGAPSPLMLKQYVLYEEEKHGKKVRELCFRYKQESWTDPYVRLVFSDGSESMEKYREGNPYADAFGFNIALSPACNACLHCRPERPGDITMGDFWHIEDSPELFHEQGTSLLMINSEKGRRLIEMTGDALSLRETDREKALASNPQLRHPAPYNPGRDAFLKALENKGFHKAYNRYVRLGKITLLPYRILRKLKLVR